MKKELLAKEQFFLVFIQRTADKYGEDWQLMHICVVIFYKWKVNPGMRMKELRQQWISE